MKLLKRACIVIAFSVTVVSLLFGQSDFNTVEIDSKDWVIDDPDATFMKYLNRKSLFLYSGIAYLNNLEFENGVIEADIAPHGTPGFAGIIFRLQSKENYELLYLRPHRSGQLDAVQYTPIQNDMEAWQLYSNEGYTAGGEIPANRWVHLKIVVSGKRADVYVGNSVKPTLVIKELKHDIGKGRIGFWARNGVANFSNLRVSATPESLQAVNPDPEAPAGTIHRWALSEAFDARKVQGDRIPGKQELNRMKWLNVESERSGLVNIGRFREKVNPIQRQILTTENDVVFAKTFIQSDRDQVKKLSFGYSDEVSIFLNGRLLFTGKSGFRSRDPSFLGIVGVENDAIYLDLKKGDNELLFAVTEKFGGWGYICKLEDLGGIRLQQ